MELEGKIVQRAELYYIQGGKARHIKSWSVFVKLCEDLGLDLEKGRVYLDEKDMPSLGNDIVEWPESTPEADHTTDRLYKMLYVCPATPYEYGWLDEIQEVGFNVVHTYITDKYPWEKALDDLLNELDKRDMYGCFQLPHDHIENFISGMSKHPNAILSSVEEPDAKAGRTSPAEQLRIYKLANKVKLPVWGCLDWGLWKERVNFNAFDVIITDSYPYNTREGSKPVAGTLASQNGDRSLPWWTMNKSLIMRKIEMIKTIVPPKMPIINIGQGFYVGNNPLPNVEEEWKFYNEHLGLNSFAIYPHGIGQGFTSVMSDGRPESYSIKNQCQALIKKLG